MARLKLTPAQMLKGVTKALKNKKTPKQFRESLIKRQRELRRIVGRTN